MFDLFEGFAFGFGDDAPDEEEGEDTDGGVEPEDVFAHGFEHEGE